MSLLIIGVVLSSLNGRKFIQELFSVAELPSVHSEVVLSSLNSRKFTQELF